MKKMIIIVLCIVLLFSSTIVLGRNEEANLKEYEDTLKDSLNEWGTYYKESVSNMEKDFFKKGFPQLAQSDATRLIINLLIFSCIANVGISLFILKKDPEKKETVVNTKHESYYQRDPKRSRQIEKMIQKKDSDFHKKIFCKELEEKYIQMEQARGDGDLEALQQVETQELFRKHVQQLEEEKLAGQIRKTDNIRVSTMELVRYTSNELTETIVVVCQVAKVEFWVDVQSGNVVKGNRKKVLKCYEKMSLMRDKGTKEWHIHAESEL